MKLRKQIPKLKAAGFALIEATGAPGEKLLGQANGGRGSAG